MKAFFKTTGNLLKCTLSKAYPSIIDLSTLIEFSNHESNHQLLKYLEQYGLIHDRESVKPTK